MLENLALAIPFFEERMRDVKPGITGLAQISLSYTGKPHPNSDVAKFEADLTNPFRIEGAEDAVADFRGAMADLLGADRRGLT